MTEKYRLMIYFAVATFQIYRKDLVLCSKMTVKEFRDMNPNEVTRVFEEAKTIFNYELSWEQMDRAITCYLITVYKPQSPKDTIPFAHKENIEAVGPQAEIS